MIELDIKVERTFPKGKSSNLLYGGIFIVVFLFCFLFWIFLSDIVPEDIYLAGEDYMPWFALILAVMSEIIIDRIMIATGGRDENLRIEVHDQEIVLTMKKRKWRIPYSEIKEISHNLVQTRFSLAGSRYRLKIILKEKPALIFCNSTEEWNKKISFEDTGLGSLYSICRSKGIKCS